MALPKRITKVDAADLLGMTRMTLDKRIADGAIAWPPADWASLVAQHLEYEMNGRIVGGSAKEQLEAERVRKLKIANDAAERRLVPLADMKVIAAEAGAIFASGLAGLPGRLANELAGISEPGLIRERLRFEATRIRKAAADRLALLGSLSGDGGAGKAAADPKPRRVGKRKPRAPARKRRAGTVSD